MASPIYRAARVASTSARRGLTHIFAHPFACEIDYTRGIVAQCDDAPLE
jgi:hypothetical protein